MTNPTPENAETHPDLLVRLSPSDRKLVRDAIDKRTLDSDAFVALCAVQAAVERAEREQVYLCDYGCGTWLSPGNAASHDCSDWKDVRTNPRVSTVSTPSSAASPPRYFRTTNNGLPGVTEFQ